MSEVAQQHTAAPFKLDLGRVSDFLSRKFREATDKLPRANRSDGGTTNTAYQLQQEFCYRLDEIQRGPSYLAPKLIQQTVAWVGTLGGAK